MTFDPAVVSTIGYRGVPDAFDEMATPEGAPRPHWAPLARFLERGGPSEIKRRAQTARRALRENGATYQTFGERGPAERPWPLDLIPHVVSEADWRLIADATRQRARLLNAVLADVYGPQALLSEGLLPPEVIFANPGFIRACFGLRPPENVWLHVAAADFARSPDGRWWVIGDRAEAPMGAGYALENRLVVSRALPEPFEASGVRRLAGYFQSYKNSLAALTPGRRENPRIVLLTSGPASEAYFEHAFLARYLSYSLVEADDLTVRDRRVFLKTLGGLLPVDVILRRRRTSSCDPLEIPGGEAGGVPGLTDAVRAGHVAIANALGSGFAEAPALLAFLPNLCRRLLGEELLAPSAATWWCGRPTALEEALARIDEVIVKPAFRTPAGGHSFPENRSADERARLIQEMRRRPGAFVAQERVNLSNVPTRDGDGLSPRPAVARAFAVSSEGSYVVMPGGLARVAGSSVSRNVSVESGGRSKDVWVLGAEPEPTLTLLTRPRTPIDVNRATFDLPSRVAENLYWLGRHSERVGAGLRLIRAVLPLLSDESVRGASSAPAGAMRFLRAMGYARPAQSAGGEDAAAEIEREARSLVADPDRRGGLAWTVAEMHRIAGMLRDRLATDAWRALSGLERDFSDAAGRPLGLAEIESLLDDSILALTGFTGSVTDGMTRGHGWRLLDFGRRLERALQVCALLEHGLVERTDDESGRIELLLDAADSSITYRSRYLTSMQADLAIDLLLIDEANPRAVAFQLVALRDHVESLPTPPDVGRRSPEARLVTDALAAVQLANLEELAAAENGWRTTLASLVRRVVKDMRDLSETLTRGYLTHAAPYRRLTVR